MTDQARYRIAFDDQLRMARRSGVGSASKLGPLHLLMAERRQGLVIHPPLRASSTDEIGRLVGSAVDHFRERGSAELVDWKVFDHDDTPALAEALIEHGFGVDAREAVMIGRAESLIRQVSPPDGVGLRRITSQQDVRAMERMQGAVFDDDDWPGRAEVMLDRLGSHDGTQLWVAECAGRIIGAGRLEPVPGTEFAELCGGATLPHWRRRGVYRALTAQRARAALALGKTLVHSSSSASSRPVLELAGLHEVSRSTTYRWIPSAGG